MALDSRSMANMEENRSLENNLPPDVAHVVEQLRDSGYELIERIGQGGMGMVFHARDAEGRDVALKVLRPEIAYDALARERLGREVSALKAARSEHVAQVCDAELEEGLAFLVTDYIQGPTLQDAVQRLGALHPEVARELGLVLAEALQGMHAAGLVHRDLKPSNIILRDATDEDLTTFDPNAPGIDPVIIDFGIAQAADESRLTSSGMVMGTVSFLDPLMLRYRSGDGVPFFADQWAWAAVIAYAATGREPFGNGNIGSVIGRAEAGEIDVAGMPVELARWVCRALVADRNLRATFPFEKQIDELSRLSFSGEKAGAGFANDFRAVPLAARLDSALDQHRGQTTAMFTPPVTDPDQTQVLPASDATRPLADQTRPLADQTRPLNPEFRGGEEDAFASERTQLLSGATYDEPTQLLSGTAYDEPTQLVEGVDADLDRTQVIAAQELDQTRVLPVMPDYSAAEPYPHNPEPYPSNPEPYLQNSDHYAGYPESGHAPAPASTPTAAGEADPADMLAAKVASLTGLIPPVKTRYGVVFLAFAAVIACGSVIPVIAVAVFLLGVAVARSIARSRKHIHRRNQQGKGQSATSWIVGMVWPLRFLIAFVETALLAIIPILLSALLTLGVRVISTRGFDYSIPDAGLAALFVAVIVGLMWLISGSKTREGSHLMADAAAPGLGWTTGVIILLLLLTLAGILAAIAKQGQVDFVPFTSLIEEYWPANL